MQARVVPCALASAAVLAACGALSAVEAASDFDTEVLPYFERNCFRCHGPDKQKANLRLDALSRDFEAKPAVDSWREVIERLKAGEMPPRAQRRRPSASETARVVEWLTSRIERAERARLARRGPVSHYRLSRVEYANTIRDLLGVSIDATGPGGLIADDAWQGFERIGSALSLSPAHIDRYYSLAERALAEAFPDERPEPARRHLSAVDLAGGPETFGSELAKLERTGLAKRIRLDLWPGQAERVVRAGPWAAGRYRVRIQVSGLAAVDGRRPHLVVEDTTRDRVLSERDIVTRENEPIVVELDTHLAAGDHELALVNEVSGPPLLARLGRAPFVSLSEGRIPWQIELLDEHGTPLHPVLIVDWLEWEGPLAAPPADDYPRDGIAGLARFAERAFRRPLRAGELAPFENLVAREIERGESRRSAQLAAMLAVLCSDDFLYLVEGSPERTTPELDDWQLASRLSYFLWSTMPDAELLAVAGSGRLHEHDILSAQVERMLADERAAELTREFPRQWLELGRVGMFPPDADLYPDYDSHLERSMVAETTGFFAEVMRKNLPIRELLASDWTVLNPRLARHYGIAGVTGDGFRVTKLAPEHRRGGILTQASVLSLTSDGLRQRPVHRGVWLSQAILGRTPPSPPANVEPIEPIAADAAKASFRDQLEAHRKDPTCASCHAKIDPLGLAFDNYDAIGRWRTREHVPSGTGEDPAIDASGTLPDGRRFAGARELQALLLADIDTFHRAFVDKLATFALRRPMSADDCASLAAIAAKSKADDYRLRDLVLALVLSDLFQRR